MIKRFLPIAGLCGLLSVALAGTAAAGGGGGYGGPGHFQFSDTTAYATFGDPSSGDYLTGIYVGSATGGKPGLQSSIGYGGGGGGEPPTLITDIVVNMTWTGSGALWKNSNSGTSKCGSYTASFHGTFDYEYSTATGTVGDVTGSSDPFAQVGRNTQDSNAASTPSGACNPFGF